MIGTFVLRGALLPSSKASQYSIASWVLLPGLRRQFLQHDRRPASLPNLRLEFPADVLGGFCQFRNQQVLLVNLNIGGAHIQGKLHRATIQTL